MPSMFWVHFYDIVEILRDYNQLTTEYNVKMNDLTRLTNDIYYAGLVNSGGQKHQYTNARLNMDYPVAIAHIMTTGRYLVNTGEVEGAILYRVTSNGTVVRFNDNSTEITSENFIFNTDVKRREMRKERPTDTRYEQHEGLEPREVFESMLSRKGWAHISFRINKGLEFYILAVKPKEKKYVATM